MTDRKPIVVVGSINMDFVVNADRLPIGGETILGNSFQMLHGGKGANQAVAVARLGYPVQMIGRVGDDEIGHQLRQNLSDAGVEVSAVDFVSGPSGVAAISVASNGENCIVVVPGANSLMLPAVLDNHLESIRNAGFVLTQLEIPLETVMYLAELCAEAHVPLLLNPAPACLLPDTIWNQIRWFTPNRTEAILMSGLKAASWSPQAAARKFLDRGTEGVIVTMGSAGAYMADGMGTESVVPSFSVKAVDTTGAGDAFNGAFATGLMMGKSPTESMQFASAASAISVTRAGAQSSMATLQEVQGLLRTKNS
jgi:ribokinase